MIKQWYIRKNGKTIKADGAWAFSVKNMTSSVEREPTEAEAALVLAELNDAIATAERIVKRMDTTHLLLQDCVREVREARDILVESNTQATLRAGVSAE